MQDRIRMKYLSKLGINPTEMLSRRNSERSSVSSVSSRATRRVRFNDNAISVIKVPSLRNLDPTARKDIWYTTKELRDAAARDAMEEWIEHQEVSHEVAGKVSVLSNVNYHHRGRPVQLFQSNKQLAIRNACLRPPVSPNGVMAWPQCA